jgi:hypothetical protein
MLSPALSSSYLVVVQVRSLSIQAVRLNGADGVAASRLPAGRRFTSCTRLRYTCGDTEQQHLAALQQTLEHAATSMPQVASLQLELQSTDEQQQQQQQQQGRRRMDTSLPRLRASCFR